MGKQECELMADIHEFVEENFNQKCLNLYYERAVNSEFIREFA